MWAYANCFVSTWIGVLAVLLVLSEDPRIESQTGFNASTDPRRRLPIDAAGSQACGAFRSVVRTQARAAYLTLLRCAKDGHVLDQAIEVTLEMLLVAFGNVWLSDVGCALNIILSMCSISSPWFGNALQKEISSNWAKPNSVGVLMSCLGTWKWGCQSYWANSCGHSGLQWHRRALLPCSHSPRALDLLVTWVGLCWFTDVHGFQMFLVLSQSRFAHFPNHIRSCEMLRASVGKNHHLEI